MKNLTGRVFHYLTVLGPGEMRRTNRLWICRCVCGQVVQKYKHHLLKGDNKSCGCKRSELTAKRQITHNMSYTKIYSLWHSMIGRCQCKTHHAYHLYGGRGITVCERWRDFANFYADMGDRPAGKQLDRINNDGPYSPENCRWADTLTQIRNRRSTIRVTHNGITKHLIEWAREYNISYGVLLQRYRKSGQLLTHPVKHR